jgi:hypothetical protein
MKRTMKFENKISKLSKPYEYTAAKTSNEEYNTGKNTEEDAETVETYRKAI